jgi:phytoene synthase
VLARPVYDERIALLVERLLRTAGELYRRADFGVAMLPRDCRVAIRAARLIYGDIGRAIAANRYDSVNRRAVVSTARKLWLLVRALPARFEAAVPCNEPALPEVRFLIDACHLPSSTRSAKRAT